MKKKITYTDGPIGDIKVVRDALPPPSALAFREEQIKVTIGLSRSSVNFFKKEAKLHHTQYQRMIRNLLDLYVVQHQ
ncbi:MAG: CopG family transcriptional regulator [Lentisphaerae bacterium]|nr:CopG family transcriptional regulator [Lentisphaerota bacterium]